MILTPTTFQIIAVNFVSVFVKMSLKSTVAITRWCKTI